jgi:hypothetical protein
VDLDAQDLFGSATHDLLKPVPRMLNSSNSKAVQNFLRQLEKSETIPHILQRIQELEVYQTIDFSRTKSRSTLASLEP